jgi:hypothetical protein
VTIQLRLVPTSANAGAAWSWDAATHTAQIVLPEPVTGTPDRCRVTSTPSPLPTVRRKLTVGREFGGVALGRRYFLDSIDIFDDYAELNYRLQPGKGERDLGWEFAVTDDLDTDYDDDVRGAYGGDRNEIRGCRDFSPAPPPEATRLFLVIYNVSPAWQRTEVGRVTVSL